MAKVKDISGQRRGRLLVIFQDKTKPYRRPHWRVKCDCGNLKIISGGALLTVKSCGCLVKELVGARFRSHGKIKSPEYYTWKSMKQRCLNQKHPAFRNYGGRGISISLDWLNSFSSFLKDMGPRPENLTLDRIDNDKGYSKENCRWATRSQQIKNQRKRNKKGSYSNDPP